MTHVPADEPLDERLGQLLDVEQRLQRQVEAARLEAERRVADARAAADRRQAEAQDALSRADDEQARQDHEEHARALAAIETAHRAALSSITAVPDEHIDALARLAVRRVLEVGGGAR